MRGSLLEGFGGKTVDDICGSVETVNPVGRRHGALEEVGPDDIVNGWKGALSFAILCGSVGAGQL